MAKGNEAWQQQVKEFNDRKAQAERARDRDAEQTRINNSIRPVGRSR
jgi:hypothetical protein